MNPFKLKSNIHEVLLKDLCHGVDFTSKSSTIPNPIKLESLISYAMSNTSKLAPICLNIEKKIYHTLPNHGLFGSKSQDITKTIMSTTLPSIRECTLYVNILRAIVIRCNLIGILHFISDTILRVIIKLIHTNHEELFKLFHALTMDSLRKNDQVDFTALIDPILSVCTKETTLVTSLPSTHRQVLGFIALHKLIEVTRSRHGHLELHFSQIFAVIVDNMDIESFHPRNQNSSDDRNISDLSLRCLKALVALPSSHSVQALVNTMITYFDAHGWLQTDLTIQIFTCLNVTAFIENRIVSPAVSALIGHANFIATSELAENISKAESLRKKNSKKINMKDLKTEPGIVAAEYVATILEIAAEVVRREAEELSIEMARNKEIDKSNYINPNDITKNFYNLTHLLWMCIVWKTFYSNASGSIQPHDIVLQDVQYNDNCPILHIDSPVDTENISISNSTIREDGSSVDSSTSGMKSIVSMVWRCLDAISIHQFPTGRVMASVIPSLFRVLHEKVQTLVETQGVRLDLLIPAKNAMYVYVLHAVCRLLAIRGPMLIGSYMIERQLTPVSGNIICELALLLRSRSWQTQSLAINVLSQLFASYRETSDTITLSTQSNRSADTSPRSQPHEEVATPYDTSPTPSKGNPWAPFSDKLVTIVRDGIFNALCTTYSHQAHSTIALYHLQTIMLRTFKDEELFASIPVVLALEEFWSVFGSANLDQNESIVARLSSSSINALRTFKPFSDQPEKDSHAISDEVYASLEMLRCQRSFFIGYFLFISKQFALKSLELFVRQKKSQWSERQYLSNRIIYDDAAGSLAFNSSDSPSSPQATDLNGQKAMERIDPNEYLANVLNSLDSNSQSFAQNIANAFEMAHVPVEDPFRKLEDLHAQENVSKRLFQD